MCRMVGMISPIKQQQGAAQAALLPSWFHLVGAQHSLRQQAELGCVPTGCDAGHADSWGIGWFDAAGQVSLVRQTGSAADSGYFVMTAESASRGGAGSGPAKILTGHLRKASMGGISSENAHPVRADFRLKFPGGRPASGRPYDTLLVAHNGTIQTPLFDTLRDDLLEVGRNDAARSDNDTVMLAAWLALHCETGDNLFDTLAASLRELLQRAKTIAEQDFGGDVTKCYTALNLLISHADGLFVLRQFSREAEYYTLYRRPFTAEEGEGTLIASERTDDAVGWEPIAAGVLTFLPTQATETERFAQVAP